MSQRKVAFVFDEYYHIYNRGNSKQVIFRDDKDYSRFQFLLFVANGQSLIDFREVKKQNIFEFERGQQLVHIGAYCLMPNHFHILLTPAVEHGVQAFMQKLSVGYAMYFNKKYERTGGLFEGRFKSELADSDEYLKYLFSYIHLNPVKLIQKNWKEEGIRDVNVAMQYLKNYKHSSFQEYDLVNLSEDPVFGNSKEAVREVGKILNREVFPAYFRTREDFRREILEWVTFNPKQMIKPEPTSAESV